MKAQIQRFHSPDVELPTYSAEPTDDIEVLIQVIAGPAGSIAEESFDVLACNPVALARIIAADGPVLGRHLLIVSGWDWNVIETFLTDEIMSCEGDDWPTLAQRIGRIGKWEFEDYVQEDDKHSSF